MSARASAARGYRLRAAPRARKRGAPASRMRWDRLGRVALVLVLFAVLVSYVNPAVNFIDAWRDSRAEYSQLRELRSENAKLRQRVTALDGVGAAERAARRLGMVEPGEGSYVIRGLDD
jgi:cell division protein FtsB